MHNYPSDISRDEFEMMKCPIYMSECCGGDFDVSINKIVELNGIF